MTDLFTRRDAQRCNDDGCLCWGWNSASTSRRIGIGNSRLRSVNIRLSSKSHLCLPASSRRLKVHRLQTKSRAGLIIQKLLPNWCHGCHCDHDDRRRVHVTNDKQHITWFVARIFACHNKLFTKHGCGPGAVCDVCFFSTRACGQTGADCADDCGRKQNTNFISSHRYRSVSIACGNSCGLDLCK